VPPHSPTAPRCPAASVKISRLCGNPATSGGQKTCHAHS